MGEILSKHLMMASVFFVFFILCGVGLINEMIDDKPDYLSSVDTDEFVKFNQSFNKFDDLDKSISKIQENVQTKPDEGLLGKFGMLGGLINSAWNTIIYLFTSLDFMNEAFSALANIFSIPVWISKLVIMLLVVIIAFGILRMIFKAEV